MMTAKPYLRSVSLNREKIAGAAAYPISIPAVRTLQTLTLHSDVTFLVGENGTGKSTLLEAIAVAWGFNAEGGSKNFNFATRASHSELHRHLGIVRSFKRPRDGFFLRAESYFNVATNIEELDGGGYGDPLINAYGGRSLHEQSHGESVLVLMTERFRGDGLYILDEPEAALSPMRQMAVLRRIHQLVVKRSQFLIATQYRDTDHYIVSREFLNNTDEMLDDLLGTA